MERPEDDDAQQSELFRAQRLLRRADDLLMGGQAQGALSLCRQLIPILRRGRADGALQARAWATQARAEAEMALDDEGYQHILRALKLGGAGDERDLLSWHDLAATLCGRRGDHAAELSHARACRDEGRRRALMHPENREAQRDLSVGFALLGSAHRALGEAVEASRAYKKCVTIRRNIALEHGPSEEALQDLAWALGCLGSSRRDRGELDAAQEAYEEEVGIYRAILDDGGESPGAISDLALALEWLSDVMAEQDQPKKALALQEQSTKLRRHLVDLYGAGADEHAELVLALQRVADLYQETESYPQSLQAYLESRQLAQRWLDTNGSSPEMMQAVIYGAEGVGDAASSSGDPEAALPHYELALEAARSRIDQEGHTLDTRRAVGILHSKIGANRLSAGDIESARAAYQADLEHSETTMEMLGSGVEVVRDIILSRNDLAGLEEGQGRVEEALKHAEEAVRLARELGCAEEARPHTLMDLVVSLDRLAQIENRLGHHDRTRALLAEELPHTRRLLDEHGPSWAPEHLLALTRSCDFLLSNGGSDGVSEFLDERDRVCDSLEDAVLVQRERAATALRQALLARTQGDDEKALRIIQDTLAQVCEEDEETPFDPIATEERRRGFEILTLIHQDAGRQGDALGAAEAEVATARELVAAHPEGPWGLSAALLRLAQLLAQEGRGPEASKLALESTQLRAEAWNRNPDSADERRDLAAALEARSAIQSTQKNRAFLAEMLSEAAALRATAGDDAENLFEIAQNLESLSDLHAEEGDAEAALEYAQGCVRIREGLTAAISKEGLEDLVSIYTRVVDLARDLGQLELAASAAEKVLDSALHLAREGEGERGPRRLIAQAHATRADLHYAGDRIEAAKTCYEEALIAYEALIEHPPVEDADLAAAFACAETLGEVLVDCEQRDAAHRAFARAVHFATRRIELHPQSDGNAREQRAAALERRAWLCWEGGEASEALGIYREALEDRTKPWAASETLLATATLHEAIANLQLEVDHPGEAADSALKAALIREERETEEVDSLIRVFDGLLILAEAQMRASVPGNAAARLERTLHRALRSVAAAPPKRPQLAGLAWTLARVAAMQVLMEKADAAFSTLNSAISLAEGEAEAQPPLLSAPLAHLLLLRADQRGREGENRQVLELAEQDATRALDILQSTEAGTQERPRALLILARIHLFQERDEEARSLLEEALATSLENDGEEEEEDLLLRLDIWDALEAIANLHSDSTLRDRAHQARRDLEEKLRAAATPNP